MFLLAWCKLIAVTFSLGTRLRRDVKIPDSRMLGNFGDLFVKCMRQVTKVHLYHLLGV